MISVQAIVTISVLGIISAGLLILINCARRRSFRPAPQTLIEREKAIEMVAGMQDQFSRSIYMKAYDIKEDELLVFLEIYGPVLIPITFPPPPLLKAAPKGSGLR
jgi:hypothetical protein